MLKPALHGVAHQFGVLRKAVFVVFALHVVAGLAAVVDLDCQEVPQEPFFEWAADAGKIVLDARRLFRSPSGVELVAQPVQLRRRQVAVGITGTGSSVSHGRRRSVLPAIERGCDVGIAQVPRMRIGLHRIILRYSPLDFFTSIEWKRLSCLPRRP